MKSILFSLITLITMVSLCSCTCCFYNRSSVTSYDNKASTDGRIRIDTNDAHSVAGDKEKALSTAVSGEGTATSAEANAAKTEDKKEEVNTQKQ